MDNPFPVVGGTVKEVLTGAVLGLFISAIYTTIVLTGTAGWMILLFVSVFALADIASVFATANEALNASVGYVLARIGGYLFAIWILLQANLSITSAAVNLLVLLGAFVLRLSYE